MESTEKIKKISIKVSVKGSRVVQIKTSKKTYEVLHEMYDTDLLLWQEQVVLLVLNAANEIVGWSKISNGGVNSSIIDPRIVFSIALNTPGCSSIIISHNHPSLSPEPSGADLKITDRIKKAADLLGISLCDHIIYTPSNGYYSFADNGLI